MEKVRRRCGQPSYRGRLKNRTEHSLNTSTRAPSTALSDFEVFRPTRATPYIERVESTLPRRMSPLGFRGGSAGQKNQKLLPDVSQLYSLTVCLSACLSVCTHVSRLTTRSNFTEILADVTYGRS